MLRDILDALEADDSGVGEKEEVERREEEEVVVVKEEEELKEVVEEVVEKEEEDEDEGELAEAVLTYLKKRGGCWRMGPNGQVWHKKC